MSTVRSAQFVGPCVLAMLLTLIGAGCRTDDGPARDQHPVANKEWRTVIADWYEDGYFDQSHRCRSVREAGRQLPSRSPEMQTLHADLRALEGRTC